MNIAERETDSSDILQIDQDNVPFTGERLVINKIVKQNFNNILKEHLARYELACSYAKGRKVLDAACGTGYGTKMLKDAGAMESSGVDISKESIDNAVLTYKSEKIEFTQGDVNSLPFQDSFFDMVVSFETIEHVTDGMEFIREAARVLNNEGLFIVSTPNRSVTNPGAYMEERPLNRYHQYEYTQVEFIGELLKYFDISELYGQTFIDDYQAHTTKIIRQLRGLDASCVPKRNEMMPEYSLVSLGDVKNSNPMYIVAVCRKKRVSTLAEEQSLSTDGLSARVKSTNTSMTSNIAYCIATDCDVRGIERMKIGNGVVIQSNCWLNIAYDNPHGNPIIEIGEGTNIGRRCTISAANKIVVGKNVLLGPNVFIADTSHEYRKAGIPVIFQGITTITDEVHIGDGSWLGTNCVVAGNVRIGKGCVIGANSVVNKDIPDYSVAVGTPARVVKRYDEASGAWVKVQTES